MQSKIKNENLTNENLKTKKCSLRFVLCEKSVAGLLRRPETQPQLLAEIWPRRNVGVVVAHETQQPKGGMHARVDPTVHCARTDSTAEPTAHVPIPLPITTAHVPTHSPQDTAQTMSPRIEMRGCLDRENPHAQPEHHHDDHEPTKNIARVPGERASACPA